MGTTPVNRGTPVPGGTIPTKGHSETLEEHRKKEAELRRQRELQEKALKEKKQEKFKPPAQIPKGKTLEQLQAEWQAQRNADIQSRQDALKSLQDEIDVERKKHADETASALKGGGGGGGGGQTSAQKAQAAANLAAAAAKARAEAAAAKAKAEAEEREKRRKEQKKQWDDWKNKNKQDNGGYPPEFDEDAPDFSPFTFDMELGPTIDPNETNDPICKKLAISVNNGIDEYSDYGMQVNTHQSKLDTLIDQFYAIQQKGLDDWRSYLDALREAESQVNQCKAANNCSSPSVQAAITKACQDAARYFSKLEPRIKQLEPKLAEIDAEYATMKALYDKAVAVGNSVINVRRPAYEKCQPRQYEVLIQIGAIPPPESSGTSGSGSEPEPGSGTDTGPGTGTTGDVASTSGALGTSGATA